MQLEITETIDAKGVRRWRVAAEGYHTGTGRTQAEASDCFLRSNLRRLGFMRAHTTWLDQNGKPQSVYWIDIDAQEEEDICGLCGEPGADKIAHPVHWPGERVPDGPLVHAECEDEECRRAHAALSDEQRKNFIHYLGR